MKKACGNHLFDTSYSAYNDIQTFLGHILQHWPNGLSKKLSVERKRRNSLLSSLLPNM